MNNEKLGIIAIALIVVTAIGMMEMRIVEKDQVVLAKRPLTGHKAMLSSENSKFF
jgi:hypothetical protein